MRIIFTLAVLAVILVIGYSIYVGIGDLRRKSEQRQRQRKQRDLANYAPAVLNGSPLVDVVIDQGQRLEMAAEILRGLTADEINVYLPESHGQRVRAWLQTHEERKTQ